MSKYKVSPENDKKFPYGSITVVGKMQYPSLSLVAVNFERFEIPLTVNGEIDFEKTKEMYAETLSEQYFNTIIKRAISQQKAEKKSKLEAQVDSSKTKDSKLEEKVSGNVQSAVSGSSSSIVRKTGQSSNEYVPLSSKKKHNHKGA